MSVETTEKPSATETYSGEVGLSEGLGGIMKTRVFVSSLLSILLLGVLVFLGIARGEGLGEKVYQAYLTPSIDEYLGTEIRVDAESCESIGKSVQQRLTASQAPKNLKKLVDELQLTFENGKATEDSFAWFKNKSFTSEISFPVSTPIADVITGALNFDPAQIKTEGIRIFSDRALDTRINELRSRDQLPSRVNSERWYEPFNNKHVEACSPVIEQLTNSSLEGFNSDVSTLSSDVVSILTDKWPSQGFEKVGHLVAYNSDIQASCAGSSSCAIFWIETATPCEVEVTVQFFDDNNVPELTRSAKKFVSQAKSQTAMQVSAAGTGSGGYYEIQEATCR